VAGTRPILPSARQIEPLAPRLSTR